MSSIINIYFSKQNHYVIFTQWRNSSLLFNDLESGARFSTDDFFMSGNWLTTVP
jgi:hypothetical protein